MFEKKLDDNFVRFDLIRQSSETRLIVIGGRADRQLLPKFLGQPFLEAMHSLVV